jgi:hypothetical protein
MTEDKDLVDDFSPSDLEPTNQDNLELGSEPDADEGSIEDTEQDIHEDDSALEAEPQPRKRG